jgi:hypothetical protein
MLRIDESKSKTNLKRCGHCAVIYYIFLCNIWKKIVFVVIDNKKVFELMDSCV